MTDPYIEYLEEHIGKLEAVLSKNLIIFDFTNFHCPPLCHIQPTNAYAMRYIMGDATTNPGEIGLIIKSMKKHECDIVTDYQQLLRLIYEKSKHITIRLSQPFYAEFAAAANQIGNDTRRGQANFIIFPVEMYYKHKIQIDKHLREAPDDTPTTLNIPFKYMGIFLNMRLFLDFSTNKTGVMGYRGEKYNDGGIVVINDGRTNYIAPIPGYEQYYTNFTIPD